MARSSARWRLLAGILLTLLVITAVLWVRVDWRGNGVGILKCFIGQFGVALLATATVAVLGLWCARLAKRGQRRIGTDPYCARCGYNLTGLPRSSLRCPECGQDIGRADGRVIGQGMPYRWRTVLSLAVVIGVFVLTVHLWRRGIVTCDPYRLRTDASLVEQLSTPGGRMDMRAWRELVDHRLNGLSGLSIGNRRRLAIAELSVADAGSQYNEYREDFLMTCLDWQGVLDDAASAKLLRDRLAAGRHTMPPPKTCASRVWGDVAGEILEDPKGKWNAVQIDYVLRCANLDVVSRERWQEFHKARLRQRLSVVARKVIVPGKIWPMRIRLDGSAELWPLTVSVRSITLAGRSCASDARLEMTRSLVTDRAGVIDPGAFAGDPPSPGDYTVTYDLHIEHPQFVFDDVVEGRVKVLRQDEAEVVAITDEVTRRQIMGQTQCWVQPTATGHLFYRSTNGLSVALAGTFYAQTPAGRVPLSGAICLRGTNTWSTGPIKAAPPFRVIYEPDRDAAVRDPGVESYYAMPIDFGVVGIRSSQ